MLVGYDVMPSSDTGRKSENRWAPSNITESPNEVA